MVEIYPREGTETFHFRAMSTTLIVEIYPREGTEMRSAGLANHIQCHNSPREGIETRGVKTIKSSFFSNLNDKFNPKGLYKKGEMC